MNEHAQSLTHFKYLIPTVAVEGRKEKVMEKVLQEIRRASSQKLNKKQKEENPEKENSSSVVVVTCDV